MTELTVDVDDLEDRVRLQEGVWRSRHRVHIERCVKGHVDRAVEREAVDPARGRKIAVEQLVADALGQRLGPWEVVEAHLAVAVAAVIGGEGEGEKLCRGGARALGHVDQVGIEVGARTAQIALVVQLFFDVVEFPRVDFGFRLAGVGARVAFVVPLVGLGGVPEVFGPGGRVRARSGVGDRPSVGQDGVGRAVVRAVVTAGGAQAEKAGSEGRKCDAFHGEDLAKREWGRA